MKRFLFSKIFLILLVSCSFSYSGESSRDRVLRLFDKYDMVAVSEVHRVKEIHDFLRSLIPGLSKHGVRNIVVEFGNAKYQKTADRYMAGEPVPAEEIRNVWRDTGQFLVWDSPLYEEFFQTVRKINSSLPASKKIRVILGDPPIGWEIVHSKADYLPYADRDLFFAETVEKEVLKRGQKPLLIAGGLHLINEREPKKEIPDARRSAGSLLHRRHPGKLFTLWSATLPECNSLTPCVLGLKGSKFENVSFAAFAPKGILIQKVINGEKQWVPLETSDWPAAAEMADGIIDYGSKRTTIEPRAEIYQEPSYAKELRRRAAILKDVYGIDFSQDLENAIKGR